MKSMTGFGSATRSRSGVSVSVEARSVNNRYLKLNIRSPSLLTAREPDIEALVRERVDRGTVQLNLRLDLVERPVRVRINESAVADYAKLFRKLAKKTGLGGEPGLDLLAQLPGVCDAEECEDRLGDAEWEIVRETIGTALDKLVRMRAREGANLARDFRKRKTAVAGLVKKIGARAPKVVADYAGRLESRVDQLLTGRGVTVEEKDLVRETAIFAERSDVTEEVTRLGSHLKEFGRALEGEDQLGRRLEFLIQEMGREANTISAKASDVEISRLCVDLKVELDRLKEQVQNVE